MASPPGTFRKLWFKWKSLRLPWRKQHLVGFDLAGNTYWEFGDPLRQRTRRIVKYTHRTHYADVKVTPQWLQWLRHTRFDPPSITEQQLDLVRQEQLKQLAAAADARWAAKPSALDFPEEHRSSPGAGALSEPERRRDGRENPPGSVPQESSVQSPQPGSLGTNPAASAPKRPTASPGDEWQPAPWSPNQPAKRSKS